MHKNRAFNRAFTTVKIHKTDNDEIDKEYTLNEEQMTAFMIWYKNYVSNSTEPDNCEGIKRYLNSVTKQ